MFQATAALLAFNMVCSGQLKSTGYESMDGFVPYSATYRIDLGSERWCVGSCTGTRPIARVEGSNGGEEVILVEDNIHASDSAGPVDLANARGRVALELIQRVTGSHRGMIGMDMGGPDARYIQTDGQCREEPFSGFPNG